MAQEPATVPPRRDPVALPAHPLDPVIEVLSELSSAVRAVSTEFRDGMARMSDSMNTLTGRIDGQSRASQELATEIRSFAGDKERLKGRVIMLEELEHARQEANGNAE